jgi:hypothetical protein
MARAGESGRRQSLTAAAEPLVNDRLHAADAMVQVKVRSSAVTRQRETSRMGFGM